MSTMLRLSNTVNMGRLVLTRSLSSKVPSTSVPTTSTTTINTDLEKYKDTQPTHTGQIFEESDYRLSRFIGGKKKLVNTRFAIDLIAEIPPKAVQGRKAICDGGGGPLGHPRVFINLDQPGNHSCGYCGLRFYQDHSHHH